jgi:hypothetical protein
LRARVRAPLRAAAEREAAVRLRAALCAWRERASGEAARRGWRLRALSAAAARFGELREALRRGDDLLRAADDLLRAGDDRLRVDLLRAGDDRLRVEDDLLRVADALRRVEDDLVRVEDLRAGRSADLPFGGSFTPDLLALLSPIAIAWSALFAPCLPSRMWCISSRTNSPAWVLAALPCLLARCARSCVAFSGMRATPL